MADDTNMTVDYRSVTALGAKDAPLSAEALTSTNRGTAQAADDNLNDISMEAGRLMEQADRLGVQVNASALREIQSYGGRSSLNPQERAALQSAMTDLNNARTAVAAKEGEELQKTMMASFAAVPGASAVAGSLSQVFKSMGAEMAADGNKMAIGSFGKWSEVDPANLMTFATPTGIPAVEQGRGQGTGRA